jgi:hypothetical protein
MPNATINPATVTLFKGILTRPLDLMQCAKVYVKIYASTIIAETNAFMQNQNK